MIRRYRPVVWLHSFQQRAFLAHSLGSFRSEANARRAIEKHAAKHPVVTTNGCYHRDMAKAPWYDLLDVRTEVILVNGWQPEPVMVPSVGKLGWTP